MIITVAPSANRWKRGVASFTGVASTEAQEYALIATQHLFDRNGFSGMRWIRTMRPVLRLRRGSLVVVTQRDDVDAVLADSKSFGVPYGDDLRTQFLLNLHGADYARQLGALRHALAGLHDRDVFGAHVARDAEARVTPELGAMFDVGAQLVLPMMAETINRQLGLTGLDQQTLSIWSHDIFESIFLNFQHRRSITQRAEVSVAQMRNQIRGVLTENRGSPTAADTVLGRLLRLPAGLGPMTDDEVIDSMIGVAIGWLWHGQRAALIVMDELLDRPDALAAAQRAASLGDSEQLWRVLRETLRFRPVQAFVARKAKRDTVIAAGTERAASVRKDGLVLVGTHSAMWDDEAVQCASSFDPARADDEYLIFGRFMHRCLGEVITAVQLPAMLGPVLRCRMLRRAAGRAGRLRWDGPRPAGLRVELIE